jgi:hypothetical protein
VGILLFIGMGFLNSYNEISINSRTVFNHGSGRSSQTCARRLGVRKEAGGSCCFIVLLTEGDNENPLRWVLTVKLWEILNKT